MSLLTPLAGLILAAAVIPPLLLLYFLRLRRKPMKIASTMLWEHSVEDLRANAPFQRLRPSWLLFLQLLALLLLALAIMQPQIAGGAERGRRLVLLIDRSASMNAVDGPDGMSRLEAAKEAARERIESVYAGGLFGRSETETMVIAFGTSAQVLAPFTKSRDDLFRAIDRIQPSDGESRLTEAFRLARAYLTNTDPEANQAAGDPATLELFSDGRLADTEELVVREGSGEALVYHRVGSGGQLNIGIGQVTARRPFNAIGSVEVFAGLLNWDLNEQTTDIELLVDGATRAVQGVTIPPAQIEPSSGVLRPGRSNTIFSAFEQPSGAEITVRSVRTDILPVDDVGYAIVPPPRRLSVILVRSGSSNLVQSVLEGMNLRSFDVMSPEGFEARVSGAVAVDADVVVTDGWTPDLDTMPRGRWITFGEPPSVEGIEVFGEAEPQLVLRADREHPVLRYVPLDDLFISEATLVEPSRETRVLVRGTQGPLILERSVGGADLIAVCFEPSNSTWPFMRSFVTFLLNGIEYLGRSGEAAAGESLAPGEAIATRLPVGATDARVERADGRDEAAVSVPGAPFSWGPVERAGVYTVRWDGESDDRGVAERRFAVNISDELEGHPDPADRIELGATSVEGTEATRTAYTPLWPYAAAFCLVVLMLEWVVYTRKSGI